MRFDVLVRGSAQVESRTGARMLGSEKTQRTSHGLPWEPVTQIPPTNSESIVGSLPVDQRADGALLASFVASRMRRAVILLGCGLLAAVACIAWIDHLQSASDRLISTGVRVPARVTGVSDGVRNGSSVGVEYRVRGRLYDESIPFDSNNPDYSPGQQVTVTVGSADPSRVSLGGYDNLSSAQNTVAALVLVVVLFMVGIGLVLTARVVTIRRTARSGVWRLVEMSRRRASIHGRRSSVYIASSDTGPVVTYAVDRSSAASIADGLVLQTLGTFGRPLIVCPHDGRKDFLLLMPVRGRRRRAKLVAKAASAPRSSPSAPAGIGKSTPPSL